MFEKDDVVVRNTALSDDEVYEMISSFEMYDKTRLELIRGEKFTIVGMFDGRDEVRVQTPRGTNVRMPIDVLVLHNNILNEGDEL